MRPLSEFTSEARAGIRYVLTDIDDTLTLRGRLPGAAMLAMEQLRAAGIKVVPITGRPAGWCDHIARMWPVDGVVGENGAFYFYYDESARRMVRRYFKTADEREADRKKLAELAELIPARVPGCAVSADQHYRESDLAIDFCEDVPPLGRDAIEKIVELFTQAGATAKISSIHVNGWFGGYDKLSMTETMFREIFGEDLDAIREHVVFSGDSPNDEPMFAYFPNAVGVANVLQFSDRINRKPAWITQGEGGNGFAELAAALLDAK
ncbi:MAG TPA: HAD-IIB family hydrolase [bacterium]|nr:HAD-IIB family hydrolase [bacterium]